MNTGKTNSTISDAEIAEQAAEWMLVLSESNSQDLPQQRANFEVWQQVDPRHAIAAQRVQGFVSQVSGFKDAGEQQVEGAREALGASLQQAVIRRRKKVAKSVLGILLIMGLPALVALQKYPLRYLGADMHASAGQWESHALPDGSRLTLSGKGAVDLDFNHEQRTVTLLSGEIHIDVAPDSLRPFVVKTHYGNIQALGTRFIVNHQDKYKTRLSMIESKVRVDTGLSQNLGSNQTTQEVQKVQAGEQISLSTEGLSDITPINADLLESSWQNHQLLVQGWTLAEVLTELNRFHSGYIYFDADSLQSVQVSAVLPLDKPEQALQLLAENFPHLQVQQFSPWFTVVSKSE